jgi:hypothetical protein
MQSGVWSLRWDASNPWYRVTDVAGRCSAAGMDLVKVIALARKGVDCGVTPSGRRWRKQSSIEPVLHSLHPRECALSVAIEFSVGNKKQTRRYMAAGQAAGLSILQSRDPMQDRAFTRGGQWNDFLTFLALWPA